MISYDNCLESLLNFIHSRIYRSIYVRIFLPLSTHPLRHLGRRIKKIYRVAEAHRKAWRSQNQLELKVREKTNDTEGRT